MVKNNLTITHPELCKEWHPTLNGDLKPEDFTAGSKKKIYWLLPYDDRRTRKHFDFVWESSICNRVKGRGCPYIAKNAKVWIGFNDLVTLRPDLISEWDFEKNEKGPECYTQYSGKKVFWKKEYYDSLTGKFFVFKWQNSIMGHCNGGCPYLSARPKVWVGFNDLATVRKDLVKEWDFEKNEKGPECYTQCSSKKVFWRKEYYDQLTGKSFVLKWSDTISHRTRENRDCPFVSASLIEKLMFSLLNSNNIEFEMGKRFVDEVKYNSYDIFLCNENLIIELDGKQHFKAIKYFDINYPFSKRIENDNKKSKYAFENNIPLLRIPYTYFEDELKIEALVMDFIRTRVIPKEIIDFYREYEFSNYAELAEKYNETLKLKVS